MMEFVTRAAAGSPISNSLLSRASMVAVTASTRLMPSEATPSKLGSAEVLRGKVAGEGNGKSNQRRTVLEQH